MILVLGLWAGSGWAADIEEAQYNAAVALYNAGQWQAALTKIDDRLKLSLSDEMRAKYFYARGLALEQGGRAAEARAAYASVVEKFPQAPEANLCRAAMLYLDYAGGRADAVVQNYKTINQGPLSPEERRNLALMYAESLSTKDDPKAALAAYQAAIALGADAKTLAPKLFPLYARLQLPNELLALTANPVADVKPDLVALTRAEALLALGRAGEVDAEAAKVPAASPLFARAAFVRAQALIKLGKLAAAAEPLQVAINGLKDPPAPAAAHVALAECLVDAKRTADAEKALTRAAKMAAALPDAERKPLDQQISTVRLRLVTASGDPRQIARAVTEAGDAIPADQRAQFLYLKLHALANEGNNGPILDSLKTDQPALQNTAEDGSATLIYYKALKDARRVDEAGALLEAYLKRQPATPEATKSRFELGRMALDKPDHAQALAWLAAATGAAGARDVLGAETYADALYNQAVVAFRLEKPDDSIRAAELLIAAQPGTNRVAKARVLAGQASLLKKDYAGAARQWTQALATGAVEDEPGLREQLGEVLFAAQDYAGAIGQFTQAAEWRKTDRKHARASQEAWARALFQTGAFAAAGDRFGKLAEAFPEAPAYAYEAAVAYERAGQAPDAERWYETARRSRAKLPAEYAAAVDPALARLRLAAGIGDRGLGWWLDGLAEPTNQTRFAQSAAMIRRLIDGGPLTKKVEAALVQQAAKLSVGSAEYFVVGALRLNCLADLNRPTEAAKLAGSLVEAFATHEKSLDPQSLGATLAPAMIYYFQAETARQTGHTPEALAAYQTVLAAYPYNEWPDAAACGAAECYVLLSDTNTAVAKFGEVAAGPTNSPASVRWIELARKRLNELTKKE